MAATRADACLRTSAEKDVGGRANAKLRTLNEKNNPPGTGDVGGQSGGSSKQVGVSLVEDQFIPKKRRQLQAQFVLQGSLFKAFEQPLRVQSELRALMQSELNVDSTLCHTLKKAVSVGAALKMPVATRLSVESRTVIPQRLSLQVTGQKDYSQLDRLIELAKLVQ